MAFSRRIWHFFTSIRLAIALILILVSLSLVGALLPQVPPEVSKGTTEYLLWLQSVIMPKFGIWAYILSFVGFLDIFHSLMFLATVTLLMLNILCCTANRWRALRQVKTGSSVQKPADFYTTGDSYTEINSVPGQASDSARIFKKALSNYHYRVRTVEASGNIYITAEKYGYTKLLSLFSHLGLVLMTIGFLIGSYVGFRDTSFIVPEGAVRDVGHETGLSLELISFKDEYWPEGLPRDYQSDVVIYERGEEVRRGVIRVNHPLMYNGVHFYQSFFGPAAKIMIRTSTGEAIYHNNIALSNMLKAEPFYRPIGTFKLPESGLTVCIIGPDQNSPDLMLSNNEVGLELYDADKTEPLIWSKLELGVPQKFNNLEFTYLEANRFSGFQVKRDPGSWLVWISSSLVLLGIILVFFLQYRKIWALVRNETNGNSYVAIRLTAKSGFDSHAELSKLTSTFEGDLVSTVEKL